jgi:hypothetical protein
MLTYVFWKVSIFMIHYKALFQDIDLLFTVGHPTAPLVLDSCERECSRHVGKKPAEICKFQFLVAGVISAVHSEAHTVTRVRLTARETLTIHPTLGTTGAKELQEFFSGGFFCQLPRLVLWIPFASCSLDCILRVKGAAA